MEKGVAKTAKKPLKSSKKSLVVLDAHAIIHRAYHALPEFTTSFGEPTGAVYGVCTMLLKIIEDFDPTYIIAAYDRKEATFRHESYENYKAGRAKLEDALVRQLETSKKVFEAFHIPVVSYPGFEADDVIGTIAKETKKEKNLEIIIASGDMDTLQLVEGKRVRVFTLRKGINDTVLYDEESVMERFGFSPDQIRDYKGLRGDPSDNIIGVPGVGEKTATVLVQKFGTIENILKELKKKDFDPKSCGITKRIQEIILENEEEAKFSKELATIRRDAPIDFKLPGITLREGIEISRINKFFDEYEFRSLKNRTGNVFGIKQDTVEEKKEIEVEGDFTPLCVGLFLLNSENTNPTKIDVLTYTKAKSFNEAKTKIESDIKVNGLGYVYNEIELPLIPILKRMTEVGVLVDREYLADLSKKYHKVLDSLEKKITELAGVSFNINSPKQLGEIIFDKLGLKPEGGKRLAKTTGGARSTKESELEKLRGTHPIIDFIFEYRELQKLLSTYIDTFPTFIKEDGRIHATWNQSGASTGRFSSSDPGLQNIPTKTQLGKAIRDAFVAKKGSVLVSCDYSQIELRVLAMLSGDKYLKKVFEDGLDVHSAVAMKVFGVEKEGVTSEMRRRAKIINFGIIYGMGVSALKTNLGSTREEAEIFYRNYFEQFPTIGSYLQGVKDFAKKHGYTETLFGRRRQFPGMKSKIPFIVAMAERMAINAPLQGTAADIIKIAIIKIDEYLKENNLLGKVELILQVHDELVFEIEESVKEKVSKDIAKIMEDVVPKEFADKTGNVPLEVHVSLGKNWGELK